MDSKPKNLFLLLLGMILFLNCLEVEASTLFLVNQETNPLTFDIRGISPTILVILGIVVLVITYILFMRLVPGLLVGGVLAYGTIYLLSMIDIPADSSTGKFAIVIAFVFGLVIGLRIPVTKGDGWD
jgi:type III secretory pathway component EscU